ncbi:hypothetical protein [Cohnella hashimotonis]|uniref:CBM-cenC domain-containing protein n=1 Tax=Cohnella hashimotonis TaxID=2826895 RepID=A0ABT6THL2_9BACL|nr:hypothetical protein [Cohnella hashimotonis]MDI4646320.1 hypothetical protein [Cohnella hashimotonis]
MRSRLAVALAVVVLWSGLAGIGGLKGYAEESRLSQKTYGSPEELLPPLNYTVSIFNGTVGEEEGRPVLYTTSKGKPGNLNVIDLYDYKLLRSIPLAPSESSWAHTVAPDGTVYIAADGSGSRLWSYSPVTHTPQVVATFSGESWPMSITTDDQGRVYVGTYPGGKVYRYDPSTRETKDYGRVIGNIPQEYVRSIAYQGGNVYAGTAHHQIVKVNLATGEKTDIAAALSVPAGKDTVYDLDTIDDRYLFARYTDGTGVPGPGYLYDTETQSWLDVVLDNVTGLHETDSLDGKIYFMSDKQLKTFDLATHEVALTGMTYGSGLRGADWVEFPNHPELPGKNLVTVRFDGGVAILNIETKQVHLYPSVVPGTPGVVDRIQSAPDGKLFVSGVQTSRGAAIDPSDLSVTSYAMGQADSIYPLGDKMYFGVYPEGALYAFDRNAAPGENNPKRVFELGDDQERLVNMTAAEGKLYIATIPTYGTLGGSMTVYDPATGTGTVHRNVVQNQSVLSLAYHDGKLFGSTTIRGGLGSVPTEAEAKIFVWDVAGDKKITEFPLLIPGLDKPIFIGDLSEGPDGLIWGTSNEYIFALDPDTYEIVKSKKIYPKLNYSEWAHFQLRWSADGLLYVLFNNKLTVVDPKTLDFRTIADASRFELGVDGNLYMTDAATNTILYRIQVDGEIEAPPAGIPLAVANAGFEEAGTAGAVPGWSPMFAVGSGYNYAVGGDRVFSGAKSLNIKDTLRTASVALQSDRIPVEPGKVYTAGMKIFIQSGQPSFMFRFYNASDAEVGTLQVHLDESRLQQWQDVVLSGAAPAGAVYARLIAVTTRYNISDAYYDDFYVSKADTDAPVSTASVSPDSNAQGWINEDADVTVHATDTAGSGVASVTYAVHGAMNGEPVTTAGDMATFRVSAEGKTSITYFAEDRAYNRETPRTLDINIDKTAPTITMTGAAKFRIDQRATIGCAAVDSLSGIASDNCGQPLVDLPAYELAPGANAVTAKASDVAGNEASAEFGYEVYADYDSLCAVSDEFLGSNQGVALALCAQLKLAEQAEERGEDTAKSGILKAYDHSVAALAGKKLTAEQAGILRKWANQL